MITTKASHRVPVSGILLVILAALLFSLVSVFAKAANTAAQPADGLTVAWFRFLIGAVIFSAVKIVRRGSLKPNKPHWVVLRALFNTLGVLVFFTGLQLTTVTKASILEMTSPAFVFAVSWFVNRERHPWYYFLFLLAGLGGAFLILTARHSGQLFSELNVGDLLCFGSAITGGFSLSFLRKARAHDDGDTILWYMMVLGLLISSVVVLPGLRMPQGWALVFTVLTALGSVSGQAILTAAYKRIEAATGSVIGLSKMVFGILFGVLFFGDQLGWITVAGMVLVLSAGVGVSGILDRKNAARTAAATPAP